MALAKACRLLALGVAVALAAPHAQAYHPIRPETDMAEHIHVVATSWGLSLAADGSGFYNDLAGLVLGDMFTQQNYMPLPYARAKMAFLKEKEACLYPSNLNVLADGGEIGDRADYIESLPFLRVTVHFFGQRGKKPPQYLADLSGQVIGYPHGSRLPTVLDVEGATYIPVADETGKARMLLAGRVDMITGSLPDIHFVFSEMGEPLPPYDPQFSLAEEEIGLVCHDRPETRVFLERINQRLRELQQDGLLGQLMQDAGIDPAQHVPARLQPVSAR